MSKIRQVEQGSGQVNLLTIDKKKQEQEKRAAAAKVATGATLALGAALGISFKDGISSGFQRIGGFTNTLSNVISVPFSLLFFPFIANNERAERRGESKSKDDIFNKMVYTAASLGFTPNTWGDPLIMGTRSKPHLITTVLNLPHLLFSFFSYSGGRLMSFIKTVQMNTEKDPIRKYQREQEFNAFFTLGNLGSAQASVIPMSGQFILGWETITDILKGDLGSAWGRFRHEPISVVLGTLFNSWMYPFEYLAKYFDTTIRTAESVDSFKNAFNRDSKLIKGLEWLKNNWHKEAKKQDTLLGKFLKWGREASKVEALVIPPIGMIGVVTPTVNKFLRGEFFNKEAQEIGGTIGTLDKVFNIGAFLSHIFYTGVYATNVRIPQTITTTTFYICNLINKLRGIENKHKDPRYIEPNEVRNKIFNWGPIKTLSEWAAKKLDNIEGDLHTKKDQQLISETGRSRHIRTFRTVITKEVAYDAAHEEIYSEVVKKNTDFDSDLIVLNENSKPVVDENGRTRKGRNKLVDEKPSDKFWGNYLAKPEVRTRFIKLAKAKLEKYLEESQLLNEAQIREFMEREYDSNCTRYGNSRNENKIDKMIEERLEKEIKGCTNAEEDTAPQEQKIKSRDFLELLTNPRDWLEVLKLKTFHATNTYLPLWVRGFVDVVDFGEKGEPMWLRNLKATESGIREGDVQQACSREFMPVVAYAFQSMGKGLATIYHLLHGRLPQFSD